MTIDIPALLVGAVLLAGLYATMSFGLALIYGVMKIVNLAHAGIMMWGAYATFVFIVHLGGSPFLAPFVIVPLFFFLDMEEFFQLLHQAVKEFFSQKVFIEQMIVNVEIFSHGV